MDALDLDIAVAARMGLEEAVAATSLDASGTPIELALVAPSDAGESEWTVVIHFDCDPDNPDQGASGIEPCGSDSDAAEDYYLERIRELELDLARDRGLRAS